MRRILSALSAFSLSAAPARAKSVRSAAGPNPRSVSRSAGQAADSTALLAAAGLEMLEAREMMTVNILNPIPDRTVPVTSGSVTIPLAGRYANPSITGTVLRFNTNQPGTANSFNVELFDAAKAAGDTTQPFRTRTTPLTVANFLAYRSGGLYTNSIIHRTVNNFIMQGGGYSSPTSPSNAAGPEADPRAITPFAAVTNEPGNSNVRGTIAMARVGGQINSATSQWFVNTANNNSTANGGTNLDAVDQGFTAFGRVLGGGMTVVDAMAAVPTYNANSFYGLNSENGPLRELPLRDLAPNTTVIQPGQFVTITSIIVINDITYSVGSNNGALVSPSINSSGELVLGFNPGQSGAAVITVRATSADGTFAEDAFTVGVSPVTLGPVATNVLSIAYSGLPVNLSAANPATAVGSSIASVQFFRDVNNNGLVDTGTDVLLGEDTSADGGWTLDNVDTTAFPAGNVSILAIAIDRNDNPAITTQFRSAPSVTTLAVQASTPVSITSVGTSATNSIIAYTGVPLTVTANTPTTIAAGQTITSVETFRDVNNNGILDVGTDVSLGIDTDGSDGWSISADTTLLRQGTNSLLTVARDSGGRISLPRITTLTVSAFSPVTTGTFSVDPGILARLADPLVLRLNSAATQRPGATIQSVAFYRDTNANGVFDEDDRVPGLLGTVTTPTAGGAYVLTIPNAEAAGFVRNSNVVFAIATDVLTASPLLPGRTSVPVTQIVTGAPPVTASPTPVFRGNSTILTVSPLPGVATRSVAFFVDRDNNGVISAGDTALGNAAFRGGIYQLTSAASTIALGGANTGQFTIMGRATLTNGQTIDYANSTVTVANNLPKVNTVVSSLPVILTAGIDFRLTATVSDRDGSVSRVTFYSDDNNDGQYTPGTDTAIGVDDSAAGGWTVTLSTVGLQTGSYRFFAVATDNNGGQSVPTVAVGTTPASGEVIVRLNAAPVIGTVGGYTTTRGQRMILEALQVLDDRQLNSEPATPATIRRVEFWRDVDSDGILTPGIDRLLGNGVRQIVGGVVVYRLSISTVGFPSGEVGFLARAIDSDNITGAVTSGVGSVNNAPPRVPVVSASPRLSIQPGVGTIRLTASNVADTDGGTISNVAFFIDNAPFGTFQPGVDTLLGEDTSAAGGWSVVVNTPTVTGDVRIICVVSDNDITSTNGFYTIRVNPLPVISTTGGNGVSITNPATGSVNRGTSFTVTARGVTDDTGVARVEFWRDLNNNGEIDATDQLLGNGVRATTGANYTFTGSTAGFATGDNTIMARAIDSQGGKGTSVSATLSVANAVPIVGTLAVGVSIIATPGIDNVPLTVTFPASANGAVGLVQFYLDDGDGVFDIATDTLVGTDTSAAGGWSVLAATTGVTGATARFFARVTDTDEVVVDAVATATVGTNVRPTLGGVSLDNSTAGRLSRITATAQPAADSDGTISRVEFWRDRPSTGGTTGQIDAGDQLLGVGVRQTDGTYRLTFSTTGFTTGAVTILAQSIDNRGGRSVASDVVITITNLAPTITGLTASTALLANPGTSTLTLTATGVADADGTIGRVRFYRDADSSGDLSTGDVLLGEDTSSAGGWSLANVPTTGLTGTAVRYIAIAIDNDDASTTSPFREVALNQAPTVGGVTFLVSSVARGTSVTATATGVSDPDTGGAISRVEFWRDKDNNGTISTAIDQRLGSGVRQSDGTYRLTFSSAGFFVGSAVDPFAGVSFDNTIMVRAIDSRGGIGAPTNATVNVSDRAPLAGRFVAVGTGGVVANPDVGLTLTITGPTDADGTVEEAFFYFDANGDGVVDAGTDILLGSDNNAFGGWTLLFTPSAIAGNPFVTGVTHQVLAVVRDNNNVRSVPVATTFSFNAAPVIGNVSVNGAASPDVGSLSRTRTDNTLVASGVGDTTPGSVARVEFWLDSNNDGAITAADRLLGIGTRIGTSTSWQLIFNGSIIPVGLNGTGLLLTRAIDNLGRASLLTISNITIS